MVLANLDAHHASLRAAFERRVANGPGVAEATLGLWGEFSARLIPLIGARGVEALYGRSLHLSGTRFPWLAPGKEEEAGTFLTGLRRRLDAQDPVAAAEASLCLLETFTDLLASLIGGPLTLRLLSPVWASAPSASEQEPVHEP